MEFLSGKYRAVSIALSLCILSLGFVVAADQKGCEPYVFLAFFAGALLYCVGSIREWGRNHLAASLIEALLAVCMLTAAILSLPALGGLA